MAMRYEAIIAASVLAQALSGTPVLRPSNVTAPQYEGPPPAATDELRGVLMAEPGCVQVRTIDDTISLLWPNSLWFSRSSQHAKMVDRASGSEFHIGQVVTVRGARLTKLPDDLSWLSCGGTYFKVSNIQASTP